MHQVQGFGSCACNITCLKCLNLIENTAEMCDLKLLIVHSC